MSCSQTTSRQETLMILDNCNTSDRNRAVQDTSNWTWLDITICVSTKQDLIEVLGQPKIIRAWPVEGREKLTDNYHYEFDDYLIFWVATNKVIGIGFSSRNSQFLQTENLPKAINEAKEFYGRPELIGWSVYGSWYRSVVWPDRGVLAEVRIANDLDESRIVNIIYFTPMTKDEFTHSPWAKFFLTLRPESDNIEMLPQDPFNW